MELRLLRYFLAVVDERLRHARRVARRPWRSRPCRASCAGWRRSWA